MSIFKKSVKGMLAEASARTNQFWNKYTSDYTDEYSAGTNYWLKGSLFDKKESMFKDEYGFKEDKYDFFALAQYQRAVANFVHIMTGDPSIHVQYNNNGHNMTDGKTVHLSASINEKDFDSNVGLALHESSHILYTDMDKFREAVSNLVYYPHNFLKDENGDLIFSSIDEVEKIFTLGAYSEKRDFFKSIVNIIEDLYIDAMTYTAAPGYRIYYKSLYNKFFGDEKVTRGFYDKEFMKPTAHNYLFHLCNFRSPFRNLNALPALQLVWDTLDLQNIRRLKTDEDRIELAYTIAGIITKQLSKELQENEPEQEPDDQEGDGDGEGEGDGNGNDYDYEPTGFNPGPQIPDGVSDKPLTDKQREQIQKLFEKQKDLINGDTKKTKLSKSDAQKVDAVSSVDLDEQIVARNFEDDYGRFNPRGIKTFIVRNINRKFMESDVSAPFGIRKSGWRRRDISRYIALGKVLAKKLQIRNEERVTTSTRLKSGRIDARLLHEIGSNNYEIFKQITIHEYQPSYIHLSIDQSGSMSGDKFEESVKLAVMFAVAAKQIKNLHVVISARSVYSDNYGGGRGKSTMHDTPYLVYLYDSNKHNIAHIRDVFETIYTTNTTPEGLCFEAIMGEILKQSANTDAYFINLCDGQPYMTNDKQHFVYRGVTAQNHSRKQVERMRARGINVLTYFIGHASDFRDVLDTYKTNCVHLRRADEVPKVVKAMNDQLLSAAKKNG